MSDVIGYGAGNQDQAIADLLVAQPFRDEFRDLILARREQSQELLWRGVGVTNITRVEVRHVEPRLWGHVRRLT